MAFEEGKLHVIRPFPTFVCAYQWPDVKEFNRDLTFELYKMRARDPDGIYRSNAAGCWHSADKVLTDCGEPGKKLGQMFYQLMSAIGDCHGGKKGGKYEMRMVAWAMMYREGSYATPHTHPNCHFSGVYYVHQGAEAEPKTMATGVKVRPGAIEFLDTRGGPASQQITGLNLNPGMRFDPTPGLMLVFPAWLPHFVHPTVGDGERIAVSCNASVSKYTLPPATPEGKAEAPPMEKPEHDDHSQRRP